MWIKIYPIFYLIIIIILFKKKLNWEIIKQENILWYQCYCELFANQGDFILWFHYLKLYSTDTSFRSFPAFLLPVRGVVYPKTIFRECLWRTSLSPKPLCNCISGSFVPHLKVQKPALKLVAAAVKQTVKCFTEFVEFERRPIQQRANLSRPHTFTQHRGGGCGQSHENRREHPADQPANVRGENHAGVQETKVSCCFFFFQ